MISNVFPATIPPFPVSSLVTPMSAPLQWLNIGALPRVTEFPFRVSTVGWVDRGDAHYHGRHEGGFEFCLRLRSDEPAATDRFDGKPWRTPYPHLLVQRPGVRHDYDAPAWRESFFFIYQPSMMPLLELAGVDFVAPVMRVSVSPRLRKVVDFVRDELFPRVSERGVADEIDSSCWFVLANLLAQKPVASRLNAPRARRPGVNAGDAVAQRLRAAEERMRLGFAQETNFEELARAAGMSRRADSRSRSRR